MFGVELGCRTKGRISLCCLYIFCATDKSTGGSREEMLECSLETRMAAQYPCLDLIDPFSLNTDEIEVHLK